MESKQSDDEISMMSSNEKVESVTSMIKIELENVTDGNTDAPETVVGENVLNKVTESVEVDTAANDNNGDTGAEPQDADTGIRYFEGVGKDAPGNSEEISKSVENSMPVTDNTAFIKPVEPYTVSISYTKNAGSSNESPTASSSTKPSSMVSSPYKDSKYGNVQLYAPDVGPRMYNVKGNIISRPIITNNLPTVYRAQPVHGKAESKAALNDFLEQKIRDYIGYGISDSEFGKLQSIMDGDYLRTGKECTTSLSFPNQGPLSTDMKTRPLEQGPGKNLCVVKKLRLRLRKDLKNVYPRKLKFRGVRMRPLVLEDDDDDNDDKKELPKSSDGALDGSEDGPLEPGKDLIFRVRIYRPHSYGSKDHRQLKPTRHSVFNNDVVLLGRQRLSALRDRIACANDIGMRIDISHNPDSCQTESAKQLFPSGFLFINNVFYVDRRPGCFDRSAPVREWARRRGFGELPVRDMAAVRLDQLVLKLGHPEVYMHQGRCEHLFTFSEVRLLNATDPQRLGSYPCFTHISQNQSVYCTTCAEFGAKWVVVGCSRVPFDPAFFCETCFRFYLYDRDGNKIGDFKAYSYKGNTVNFLKPIAGRGVLDDEGEDDDDSE